MMNPKERTKIFERISLSSELVDEYERSKKAMLEAKDQTQFNLVKKRAAIHKKKTLSNEKKEVDDQSSQFYLYSVQISYYSQL